MARHQRLGMVDLERVEMRSGLASDLQKVTKAARRYDRDFPPLRWIRVFVATVVP
jgi:hypothetical protein